MWSLPLWAHAAALAAILLALVPALHLTAKAWVEDEGLYMVQVEALHDGQWRYDYLGASFDPDGRWFPLPRVVEGAEGIHPYVSHPAFVAAVAAVRTVLGGELGLFLLPMVGLVVAAAAAWLLAAEIDPRASRPAFWLVVVSPLAVNAYTMWAHTLSAALAGLSLLAAVRILRSPLGAALLSALVGALAAGVLLRSEAVLFAAVVVAVVTVVLVRRRRLREACTVAVVSSTAVAVTVLAEVRWIHAILGRPRGFVGARATLAGSSPAELVERRLAAAWRVVFDAGNVPGALERSVVVALVLVVVGGLALRLRGREGLAVGSAAAGLAAVATLVLYGARFGGSPRMEVSGFFAAWPVALLGVAVVAWRATTTAERALVAVALLFAGAVLATQYDNGGGGEWGGRFLSPAVVPLGVVVAVGLVRCLVERSWGQQAVVVLAVVLIGFVPASRGIEVVRGLRRDAEAPLAVLRSSITDVVVVDGDRYRFLPVRYWTLNEHADWFVAADGGSEELLGHLAGAGVDEVTLVTEPGAGPPAMAPYSRALDVTPAVLDPTSIRIVVLREPVRPAVAAAVGVT